MSRAEKLLAHRNTLISLIRRDREERSKLIINSRGQYIYSDRNNTIPHA